MGLPGPVQMDWGGGGGAEKGFYPIIVPYFLHIYYALPPQKNKKQTLLEAVICIIWEK